MFKKKKTYFILLIIILIVGGVYYARSKKPKVEYTTTEAKRGTLNQTVSVTGKVKPVEKADVSFKASGLVEEIYVSVGDKVSAGQKIAKIDKGTLTAQLKQVEADITSQKQTLANMRRLEYKVEAENAQRALIDKSKAAALAIEEQMGELVISAPIEGVVVAKRVERGENAVANDPIVTIYGNEGIEIEADVPESDIVKVELGQKANLTFDAFTSSDIFPATVTEIEPAATVIQDVVYYKVKLKLDTDEPRLKNGMSTDVDILTDKKDEVIYIPQRAVKEENGSQYVEILKDEKQSLTEKIMVTTGMEGDDGMVEVKSGLNGGEKVVTLSKNL